MRHGDFIETAIELQPEADLFVLGEHDHSPAQARIRAEHHLERVIRGVSSSVLVATAEAFEAPQRVVVAFDGSPGARRAAGFPCFGTKSPRRRMGTLRALSPATAQAPCPHSPGTKPWP